jgi:hypothetical protein
VLSNASQNGCWGGVDRARIAVATVAAGSEDHDGRDNYANARSCYFARGQHA